MPCKNHALVEEPLRQCSRCGSYFCNDCLVEISGHPYCAACKAESMRDLRSGVPAHTARHLEMASIGRRFVALFLDSMLLTIPFMVVFFALAIPLGLFAEQGSEEAAGLAMLAFQGVITLAFVGLWILYEGTMLGNSGQTIGKKIMKIKVVTPEGNDITSGQAFGRAAVRQLLGVVPCVGLVDYLTALGQERTCIHDMSAKTRVVDWNA